MMAMIPDCGQVSVDDRRPAPGPVDGLVERLRADAFDVGKAVADMQFADKVDDWLLRERNKHPRHSEPFALIDRLHSAFRHGEHGTITGPRAGSGYEPTYHTIKGDKIAAELDAALKAQAARIAELEARAKRAEAVVCMGDNIIAEQMGMDTPKDWIAAVTGLAEAKTAALKEPRDV